MVQAASSQGRRSRSRPVIAGEVVGQGWRHRRGFAGRRDEEDIEDEQPGLDQGRR